MATVRSAKGVQVNFDLLKIKQEIAAGPKPVNVQKREDFIDRKIRRRVKKAPVPKVAIDVENNVAAEPEEQAEIKVDEPVVETPDVVEHASEDANVVDNDADAEVEPKPAPARKIKKQK